MSTEPTATDAAPVTTHRPENQARCKICGADFAPLQAYWDHQAANANDWANHQPPAAPLDQPLLDTPPVG